jgi:hypothetical protein
MSPGAHRANRSVPDAPGRRSKPAAEIIDQADASLLDVIDNLLNQGVVVNGEVILAIADVDLVYLRLSVLLCAADRVLPAELPSERNLRKRRSDGPRRS